MGSKKKLSVVKYLKFGKIEQGNLRFQSDF
jgi:hypothetical protein